jgi:prepilin signal peptidase PulO-like enzyme (type II secretory pathway)
MEVLVDYIQDINIIAVVIASLAAFVAGAVWYMDSVFGKPWKRAVGLTDKKIKSANMPQVMGVSLVTIVVSAAALDVLTNVLVLTEFYQGALFGILIAVAVIGSNKLMQVMFEQRPIQYWYIVLGADIVSFGLIGGIVAVIN